MCQNFKFSYHGRYRNHGEFTAACARRRTSSLHRLFTPSESIVSETTNLSGSEHSTTRPSFSSPVSGSHTVKATRTSVVDLDGNGMSSHEVSTSTFSAFVLEKQEERTTMLHDHLVEDTRQTYFPAGPTLDPGHEFAAPEIIEELTAVAVQRFRTLMTPPSRKRGRSPRPEMDRKRQKRHCVRQPAPYLRDPCNGAPAMTDSESVEALAQPPRMVGPRYWMCPFYVQNSKKYNTCLTRHCLLTTDDVLEHLCLMHREPLFCSICYETFPAEVDRDMHMRSRSCVHRGPVLLEGITDAQVRQFDRLVSGENNTPQIEILRWFKMWESVFPRTEPPETPFFTTREELSVYKLRRFWKVDGKGILSAVLSERKLRGYQIQDEERSLEALFCLIADSAVDRIMAAPGNLTKQ